MTMGTASVPAREFLLRSMLVEGFVALGASVTRVDDLVRRVDELQQGSQRAYSAEMREAVLALCAPNAVPVFVGYPQDEGTLPCVSIVTDAGGEAEGAAVVGGDLLARRYERVGTIGEDDCKLYAVDTIGGEFNVSLQIGTWATSPELAVLLHEIVRAVVFADKGRLTEAGVLDVGINESGFQPDPSMYPRVGYVPVMAIRVSMQYEQNERTGPLPTYARVTKTRFSTAPR